MFADAIGKARKVYLRHLGQLEDDDTGMLFTPTDNMEWLIEQEHEKAVKILTTNLRGLLRSGRQFKLVAETTAVFGDSYGFATEPAVTAALRTLLSNGEAIIIEQGKRLRDRVIGPAPRL